MELWVEYLHRHGLPIIRPQEPFLAEVSFSVYVPPRPPIEHRLWAFFLMNHSYLIANHSVALEDEINQWCDGLLVISNDPMPSLNEQHSIIFGQMPSLEYKWLAWQRNMELFTSSLPENDLAARRLSFYPAPIHP